MLNLATRGKDEVVGRAFGRRTVYESQAMNDGTTTLFFWEREPCEYCNGLIRGKNTGLSRKVKGKYVFVENVPTGVCTECGTRYYTAGVLKSIEETLHGRRKAKREVQIPACSL